MTPDRIVKKALQEVERLKKIQKRLRDTTCEYDEPVDDACGSS